MRTCAGKFTWSIPVRELVVGELVVFGRVCRVHSIELRRDAPTGVVVCLKLEKPRGRARVGSEERRHLFEDPEARVDVLRSTEPPEQYVPPEVR